MMDWSKTADETNKVLLDLFFSTWQIWAMLIVFVFAMFLMRLAAEVWIPNYMKQKKLEKKHNQNNSGENNSVDVCPKCGGRLVERSGQFGKFIGCSNYPKCHFTKKSLAE